MINQVANRFYYKQALPWQHANNPKIWWGQSLTALTYILQYAERQMPFNPDEMDIERKLFALAI